MLSNTHTHTHIHTYTDGGGSIGGGGLTVKYRYTDYIQTHLTCARRTQLDKFKQLLSDRPHPVIHACAHSAPTHKHKPHTNTHTHTQPLQRERERERERERVCIN